MTDDAAIKEAAHIPANEPLPHVMLDSSLGKTKAIVSAVQQLALQQEEADRKANKELKSHAATKERIREVESENAKARELMEREMAAHESTKDKLDRSEREHMKTREALATQRHEVSSMLLQMEALKVEMEAQRKAFVVNVNWASRCTELKVKFDDSRVEYDKLYEQQIQTKGALEIAKRAQEEYRLKSVASFEQLEQHRQDLQQKKEELNSKGALSEDVLKRLEEWQKFKDVQAAEEISKKQGRSKAMGVLERQLAQGDSGLLMNYYTSWAVFVKDEVKQRKHKDQAMKQAMKTIANDGLGLISQCFGPWKKETENQKRRQIDLANKKLEEANARSGGSAAIARKRALEQLEKQFIGQDKALTKQAFQSWATGQALRKKKDGNLQKGARMIANSDNALKAEIIFVWNAETEKTRIKKQQKEASSKKAARMIANSGKALVIDVYQTWAAYVRKNAAARKKKAAGNEKAARMMASSDKMLTNVCFDSWAKLQIEKKKKEAGSKKAARMIAGSNEVLQASCFKEWAKMFLTKRTKEGNTAKAVRMIAASGEALQAACFKAWSDDIRKSREKNKKLKAVEKTIGASADGLKLLVTTAWRNTTTVEGRKKRGKQRGFSSAMKTINCSKDLLLTQMLMSWARIIASQKVDDKQEKVEAAKLALQDAMAAATKAVEEEVGKCHEEADALKGQLEGVNKECDTAAAKAEALENQIEEAASLIKDRQAKFDALVAELEDSRKKAKDIGEELAKVGIFLQSASPRKSRPRSGAKADSNALPKLGNERSRPMSGRKGSNTKSAWNEDANL